MLESFGESPKACVTNSSRPSEKLKGKENPDLPSVCSNYWPPTVALSLCFNHLVLSTFWQSRSAIPKRSANSHSYYPPHSTVPMEKPLRDLYTCNSLTWLRTVCMRYLEAQKGPGFFDQFIAILTDVWMKNGLVSKWELWFWFIVVQRRRSRL